MAYSNSADWRITGKDPSSPGREAWAITASGSDQTVYPRSLWINTAGTVTGVPIDAPAADTAVSFTVPVGEFRMGFRRITACPASTLGIR